MPQEYSWEERQQACDLYVMGGYNFEQVEGLTGVSKSQLKRWSAEEEEWARNRGEEDPKDWPKLKKEFRLAQSSAPREKVLLRALLINNALTSKGDFKTVLAASMWEKTQDHQGVGVGRASRPPVGDKAPAWGMQAEATVLAGETPALQIKTPQDAVAVLQELVNQKVRWVAANPGQLTAQTIKDLNNILALVEELKTKYRPDEKSGQAPGLTDEAANEIRRFLGIQ